MNMNVNSKNISLWSKLGMRAVFGLKCCELAEKFEDLMVLTADVSTSAGLDRFRKTHSSQYLDCGIAEQNMMSMATGLASEGHKVITTTFAPFQTLRCLEQIKMASYMKQNLVMVGLCGGVSLANLGYSHCAIEDIGVLRSIPGITILQPADCTELVKMLDTAMDIKGLVYIRLTGGVPCPVVYELDYEFKIGSYTFFSKSKESVIYDTTIVTTGSMVKPSIDASDILGKKGIHVAVLNINTMKPFMNIPLPVQFKNIDMHRIFVVEEHSVIGGLYSALSENLTKHFPTYVVPICLPDSYDTPMGDYQFMLDQHGLTAEKIAERIMEEMI